jgi:hypothetical protein
VSGGTISSTRREFLGGGVGGTLLWYSISAREFRLSGLGGVVLKGSIMEFRLRGLGGVVLSCSISPRRFRLGRLVRRGGISTPEFGRETS